MSLYYHIHMREWGSHIDHFISFTWQNEHLMLIILSHSLEGMEIFMLQLEVANQFLLTIWSKFSKRVYRVCSNMPISFYIKASFSIYEYIRGINHLIAFFLFIIKMYFLILRKMGSHIARISCLWWSNLSYILWHTFNGSFTVIYFLF